MTANLRIDGKGPTIAHARTAARMQSPPNDRWKLTHEEIFPSINITQGFWKSSVDDIFVCCLYYECEAEE